MNQKNKSEFDFELKLYVWTLISIGVSQLFYTFIIVYNYPKVKVNLIIPFLFLILFPAIGAFLYYNRHKHFVKENSTYFMMFSLLLLGIYNGFQAFRNEFQIDYLLGTYIIIFGGILLINKHKQLIIYCIAYFVYFSLLFYFFSYKQQTIISIMLALFIIIVYSFLIQNAFIQNRQLVLNSKAFLEEQVKERTLTIENKLNIIERKNKDLEEYAHVVSHDLKAPLRSIDTLINWFKEDNAEKLDGKSIESLDLILYNVEKMDLLIKGILNYSTVDNHQMEDRVIDLNILIDELLRTIHIPSNFQVKVTNELPKLFGNDFRFKQLFQNLIQNAIKYNDKANGLIEIGSLEKENEIEFYIKDNGIGINERYQTKIFDIFSKLENNDQSSGIGLSIVKKVIDLYNGKIWLESQETIGTIFYFTIPKNHGIT